MNLRKHQREMEAVCTRINAGERIRMIVCGVTPGGGKSLLPQILGHRLIPSLADKLCWVVPRLALQDQGARGFNDPQNRALLGHQLEAMNSTNVTNPTRGHAAYVTTYQALASDRKKVNAKEFSRHRYILVLDEPHHIEDAGVWHEAIQPLYEQAVLVVLMSGTFERGDGKPIAFVPYDEKENGLAIDFTPTEERAVIRYGLRDAWEEQAVIDMEVHYVDCSAKWRDRAGRTHEVESLRQAKEKTSQALYTALHSEAALELLDMGVKGWQDTKRQNPRSKLLVVAATIEQAKRYTDWFRDRGLTIAIATSDDSASAHAAIKQFKRTGSGGLDILVTVAMAYEGLDVPAVTHLICLTHIRTKPWIEQVVHRATRVDYQAGPYRTQCAHIYAPDDEHFRSCMNFLFAERDKFRACFQDDREGLANPIESVLSDLFGGGGGMQSGIEVIGSSVVGERRDSILEQIRNGKLGLSPTFAELPPETPADRMKRIRDRIERACRNHEKKKGLPHGHVNKAIYNTLKKRRADMTEQELLKVEELIDKKYR